MGKLKNINTMYSINPHGQLQIAVNRLILDVDGLVVGNTDGKNDTYLANRCIFAAQFKANSILIINTK